MGKRSKFIAWILLAGLLASPLGVIFKHLLPQIGFHNETMIWAVSPIVAFMLVLIIFKAAGFYVHRKVACCDNLIAAIAQVKRG